MINNKRCLITNVSIEEQSMKVNNGSSFYVVKLSGKHILNFLEIAKIYQINNLGTEPNNISDPIYLQINKDGTKCALPAIPGTYVEVSINSIDHLYDTL